MEFNIEGNAINLLLNYDSTMLTTVTTEKYYKNNIINYNFIMTIYNKLKKLVICLEHRF